MSRALTPKQYPYGWIRITPDGMRALADATEKYGLPELPREPVEKP